MTQSIDHLVQRSRELSCPKCRATVDVSGVELFDVATCAQCGARFTVPAKFGSFLLLQPIRHDAATRTFRARDRTLAREVNVAVIVGEALADARLIERLHQDARAQATLNHPNVGKVYSVGEHEGAPYIVMERVPGESLDAVIARHGAIDEATAMRIGADVAAGLHAAHQANLVHGEVRPDTIWIDAGGVARVTDFVAGQLAQAEYRDAHLANHPHYVAPELVHGQQPTPACDMFSLGATLFAAITGHAPFAGHNSEAILHARLAGSPDLRDIDLRYHAESADILARLMATDPARRFHDCAQVEQAMRAAQPHVAQPLAALPEPPRIVDRAKPRRSRRIAVIATVSIALLVIVGLVVLILSTSKGLSRPHVTPVTDSFDGTVLSAAWQAVGAGGEPNGQGQLVLRHLGSGGPVGVERTLGDGDFDSTVVFSKIEWWQYWYDRAFVRLTDSRQDLRIELVRPPNGKPTLQVSYTSSSGGDANATIELDKAPTALSLRVEWRESNNTWRVFYGLDGAAATTSHPVGTITSRVRTGIGASGAMTQQIAIEAAGAGVGAAFEAQIDSYELAEPSE